MVLSVVTVNWNSRDDLAECLDSLRAQGLSRDAALDVVVVDNGSHDGSAEMVRTRFPEVTLLEAGENLGFAEGCNRGIAVTTGEWIVMLNNDATADTGWAEAILRAIDGADPSVGMLQCPMLFASPPNTINSTGIRVDAGGSGHDRHGGLPFTGAFAAEEIFCPTAGAAVYRRAMLEEIRLPTGYFDREHFMYSEDLDLGWRARLAGWKALVVPDAVVRHKHMASTARRGREWLVVMSRTNRLRTLLKNASPQFFLRALPRTAYEVGEILWYGRSKAARKLPGVVMGSLQLRRHVSRCAARLRSDVEQRWIES